MNARSVSHAQRSAPKFVVCIDNSEYPASLELHKIYRVIADEAAAREGDLRIIDESGEDYLYPAEWFVPPSRRLRTSPPPSPRTRAARG